MLRISGVLAALAFVCLLLPFASAAEGSSGQGDAPQFFPIFGPDQDTPDLPADSIGASQFPRVVPTASAGQPKPLTDKEKFQYYLRSTYGPWPFAYCVAATGISQARDSVPEWGQGMEGYGKRLGLRVGRRSIKHSIHAGLGILLHEDPRYFASNRSGIWERSLYAAGQTFFSHKDSGGIRPAYSKFIGIIGANYISRQWRPEADQTMSQYLYSSAIWLGVDAAKKVFAEFWPDIKRRLRR